MRIIQAHVFGFGKWIDETFTFKDESFICFYGKNEAGKSTLQQFFLYMLFGLPPRKLNHFKPKYSSQIGGRLTIHLPELGEVTIERIEQQFRLLLADGNIEEDESVLQAHLNDLQADTYRAIYGFSSLDLVQLHQMKQTELSDLLFSVSLTGSTAIYDLEKRFTRTLDELFKPTGRRPIINEQIRKITSLEKKLNETKKEALSYKEKINERNECEDKLSAIIKQLENDEKQFMLKEKIIQFLPQIRTLKRVQTNLHKLNEKKLNFPENGIERYERLKAQLIPITAELKNMSDTLQQYDESIINKREKLFIPERYEQMAILLDKRVENDSHKQKIAELSEAIVELQTKITDYTTRLHITETDVENFQAPFHAEATWNELIDEGKKLQHESERIEEEAKIIEQKRRKLNDELRRIEAQFIGRKNLQQMEAEIHERAQYEKQQNSLRTVLEWEQNRKKQAKQMLYATSFIAITFFIVSYIQNELSYSIFGVALTVFVLIQIFNLRKTLRRIKHATDQFEKITNTMTMNQTTDETLRKQQRLANELINNEQMMQTIQIERLQWEEKHNYFALKEHKWVRAVEQEREKIPLLKQVELDYWIELLHHIEEINAIRSEKDRLEAERASLKEITAQFQKALSDIGEQIAPNEEVFTVQHLQSAIKMHDSLEEQITQYEQLKEKVKQRLTTLQEEKSVINEQIEQLFKASKVTDEEQFYEMARVMKEKVELGQTYTTLNDQLESVFSDKKLKLIIEQHIDEYTLQREVDQLEQKIKESTLERESLQQQLATLQVEIEQLESSDDYSYATHVYEFERDKLNELAEEWAEVKLAQSILQAAKLSYQQKYIADVMAYTTKYFNYLTLGAYTTVYPPTETNSFRVEANNKMRYTVEELSKGTIDQLYVALRFAISKVMSEKFVVPLMIDDAFVHFDEERASLAVHLLEKIASEQQVILYTCKKHVADAVNEANSLQIQL